MVRQAQGLAVVPLVLLATACGSTPGSRPTRGGTAHVALAGSLLQVDDGVVGPAFSAATGYGYVGRGGGSLGLAREIVSGEITPGVFESVGTAPMDILRPRFTTWSVQVASSPLVIAYNPRSAAAAAFRAASAGDPASLRTVFEAMAQPGFRLGRTNPATDPQGQAFVMMVELAQRMLGLPPAIVTRILGPGATSGTSAGSQIFAETSLDATLLAGQLDAASALRSQAVQLHLPYVALPPSIDFGQPSDAALYATASIRVPGRAPGSTSVVRGSPLVVDVTTVHQPSTSAADRNAAGAFVAYLLSPAGRRAYARAGYSLLPEVVHGDESRVPAVVRAAIAASGTAAS